MDPNDFLSKKKEEIIIPETSISVKITNIKNPYFIRIYETDSYMEKCNLISIKLLLYATKNKVHLNDSDDPILGDFVIVHCKASQDMDLPAWLCRGIIGNFDPTTMRYNVLLVDHGISLPLLRNDFDIARNDIISDKYLTSVIGIYNIVPTIIEKDMSTNKFVQLITDKWTNKAIQFTKELITASNAMYFGSMVCDKYGKYYGELYLDIDKEIICLSRALVQNGYATYLEGDLLTLIEEGNNACRQTTKDNVTTYYIQNMYDHNVRTEPSSSKHEERYHKNEYSNPRVKTKTPEVLVYSDTTCENVDFVCDAQFPTKIHKAWDSIVQSDKPKKMQSYIWPAIRGNLNVVAIGAEGSGKTFGYIFAITGLLAARDFLPKGKKPSALILCASSSEVLSVHSLCTEFLQSYIHINSVAAFTGKRYKSLAAEIYNGCQILISTPRFLVQFLNTHKDFLNFHDLSHLVLDNADVILDKYYNSVIELFGKHKVINNREGQSSVSLPLQIILAARHFTTSVKTLVQKMIDNPYICITSYIEAVVFKSVQPKMYLVQSKFQNQTILNLLGEECELKTMILCRTIDEAEELYTFLSKYKRTLLVHEKKDLFEIGAVKEVWKRSGFGFYPIIISTDEVLSDLNITDVDWLIHYSVSLDKKTRFNYRFSTLMDNLQMEKTNCKVSIFINENDNVQFLSIINTMQRMGVVLSDAMLLNIENISISLDRSKTKYPICDKVKSLGFCPNKNTCVFRHCILSDIDAPITGIETGDKVKFMLTYVHDASHFSARIIEYVKANSSETVVLSKSEYIKVTSTIQNFYGNINNRRRADTIDVGSIYGLEDCIENFKRVQVLQIKDGKRSHVDTVKLADVRFVDTGNVLENVKLQRLLWLPDKLSKLPIHVVEVFLVNITPCDDEYEWNDCANETVHDWFAENFNKCSYVVGEVCLHLSNTIWTNILKIGTKMIGYSDVVGCCLKTELLNKRHAVVNKQQMQKIHTLHKKSGLIKN